MSEALDGTFIEVSIDEPAAGDAELARTLEEVCPVDIFSANDAGVMVIAANLDECVLCRLCIEAAPAGVVHVKKLYDGTELN